MRERKRFGRPHRAALLLATALMVGAPASGQGPMLPIPGPYSVPPVAGAMGQMPQMTAPAIPAVPDMASDTASDMASRSMPRFLAPAGAMPLPYWMQAPRASGADTRDAAMAPQPPQQDDAAQRRRTTQGTAAPERSLPPAPARTAPAFTGYPQGAAPGGYMQPIPSWGVPTAPMAPGYWGPGYGVQGNGVQAPALSGQAPAGAAQGIVPAQVQPPAAAPQGGNFAAGQTTAWPAQPGWGYGSGPVWAPAPFGVAPGWGPGWAPGWGAPVNARGY